LVFDPHESSETSVGVTWSEPNGIAWAGRTGFAVSNIRWVDLHVSRKTVVPEDELVAAILERLESSDA